MNLSTQLQRCSASRRKRKLFSEKGRTSSGIDLRVTCESKSRKSQITGAYFGEGLDTETFKTYELFHIGYAWCKQ